MENVFLAIVRDWEDRPLTVEEAKEVESKIMRPILELIHGIGFDATSGEIFALLNGVVSAYLTCFG